MRDQAKDKRAAALAAVVEVQDGMRVGLGTGTTAFFAIQEIGRRCAEGLRIEAVATSRASETQARELSIPLLPFGCTAELDLAIDGADEVDPLLRAIKGAGGAMLREKVVAASARRMIVVADGTKRVERLGRVPVPVEALPFAKAYVMGALSGLGGRPVLRMAGDEPYRTDQDNLILDCYFASLDDLALTATALSAIPGVLGHGLFLTEVDALYVAENGQVERIERPAAA